MWSWHLGSLGEVPAGHAAVDYGYVVGMEDVGSHSMIDSGNTEVAGCGSTD